MDNEIAEKICQTLFYFIPAVPRLKKLFQRWVVLNVKDKRYIDEQIANVFECKDKILYKSLKEAFVRWDLVQDTEGAPGFIFDEIHGPKCSADVQEEIMRILNIFETNIDKLVERRNHKYRMYIFDHFNKQTNLERRSRSINDMYSPKWKNKKERRRKLKKIYTDHGYFTD